MPRTLLATLIGCCIALPSYAALDERIKAAADQAQAPSMALLEQLVNIDSGSGYAPGIGQVSALVKAELEKLGATVQEVPNSAPDQSKHLVATLKGTGKARILLLAHMDTVFKEGTVKQRPFRVDGNRAYGPGVADDKGGIVVALAALNIMKTLDLKGYGQITLLLDASEETGSQAATELIASTARQHDVALNLEPGRPGDGLVIWRKGSADAVVEVKGKASHAGVAPELGRNAATEIAHQVLQLGKLGDEQKKTTVNFTRIEAGDRINVIPDHAVAKADVRAATPEEFDRVEADLKRISANTLVPGIEVSTRLERGLPPMPQTAATDKLVAQAQGIYGELGRKLELIGTGGAADISIAAGEGVPALDGFGLVGGNTHTPEEYAEVDSLSPRAYLLTRMLVELGKSQ
ncbi:MULTISPECIES: glutamate carboxypeptidase [unclassified Pseudomonas]|uniref:glutamate carboxypeptidase n=1 Tax=unclassified Pseudomonas TaxID=196821 RepID=UPI000BD34A76|nr:MULTISPECIES: glutamate carboxypeptidase [unclassified Pseudomonas]PVZ20438.1 glutamate carboxypeptidase [Pseudomonas sp. URIL14HWK12:I12]PVZ27504.1 glutamate carboxypeptidase [Pseudomonas sp. URIL14HWK12:I10]PVZ38393.1 glutamate carboxypeptidase [Pseudomonas sp. URIL14HWK12:I11]SNZ03536.1 glutamate carboxypeptidase [Pseudomonas sp. URIL14HWK12:I9]